MSAVDGICLHQIVWALEKVKDNLQEDLSEMESEADWKRLRKHVDDIGQLITDIECA